MEYNNNGQPTFGKKIPEEDIDIAAQEYGEGYEPLINCLKTCWQNGMQTFACCSGHEYEEITGERNTKGYISFIAEDKDLFNYIINKLSEAKLEYSIGLQANSYVENRKKTEIRGKTEISFYCKFEDREKFFNEFARIVKEYDREKKYKFTEEKGVTKIIELFMNRTCDDRIIVDYISTEDLELFNINYCTDLQNSECRQFTEEEIGEALSYLYKNTRPKSKTIDGLVSMCENSKKVGISQISDLMRRLKNKLLQRKQFEIGGPRTGKPVEVRVDNASGPNGGPNGDYR